MILAFDDFELDPERLELRHAGAPVKADPAVLRLLACLLRNAGQLVTKPELIAQVWNGRAMAENVITVTMVRLRRTLRQHAGERELIVNVHGRGYRFVRPVDVRDDDALAPSFAGQTRGAGYAGPPFVGREGAMHALRAALQQARQGHGSACALIGEPGIGKTRAVEMLAHEAAAAGVPVAWGACREAGETPPLWPFAQLARALLAHVSPAEVRAQLGTSASALARVVPELEVDAEHAARERTAGDGSLAPGHPTKHHVFDAIARLFALAAERTPCVLVLDDLHRADPTSLELLRYLIDDLSRMRVLLLCTLRKREQPASEPARADLRYALGHRNCARVALERLNREEVCAYVSATLGDAAGELGGAVFDKSEGNPFFMVELARQLADERQRDPAALAVPRDALEIVRQRIARLDADARGVLSAAAVLGRSFELPVLQTVSGCEPAALMAALDDALGCDVVVPANDSRTAFAFGHELLRAVLYEALPPAERRGLHLRVALALEQRQNAGDAVLPADVAYHLHAALPHGELRKTVDHCIAAAAAAVRVYANADAVRYLRHAIEAMDLMERPSARLRLNLLLWQALHTRVCAPAEFEPMIRAVIRIAREQHAGTPLARAALMLDPNPGFPPMAGSRAALQEALRLLPAGEDGLRAAVLARLSTSAPLAYDRARSRQQLAQALELAASAGSPLALYAARSAQLHLLGGLAHRAEASEAMDEIEAMCHRHPAALSVPPVLLELHRAITALQDGATAAIGPALQRCETRCRALDDRELLWHAQRYAVLSRINTAGTAEQAAALAELHARAASEALHGAALFAAYDRAVVLRDPAAGAAGLDALAPDEDDPPNVWSMKVRALSASGLRDPARSALELVAADRLAALPCDRDYLGTLGALARAALALDARAYVERLYALLSPYPDRFAAHVSFYCEGPVALLLGLLARALGRHEDAVAHLQAGLAHSERAGLAPCAQQARLELLR